MLRFDCLCSAKTRFRSTGAGDGAVGRLWHHRSAIVLLRIVLRLLADLAGLIALSVRPRRAIAAENLVLRRQLALFHERGMRPRRIDTATRASLASLSRWCDWRSCLVVVRPKTVLRWRRTGWRLFWRCKV